MKKIVQRVCRLHNPLPDLLLTLRTSFEPIFFFYPWRCEAGQIAPVSFNQFLINDERPTLAPAER